MPFKYNVITSYYIYGLEGTRIACGCTIPYSEVEVREAITRPAVVHFTNCYVAARPWVEGSRHPYAGEWLKLKATTPWADSPLWPDQKDRVREMCSHIYHVLPIWLMESSDRYWSKVRFVEDQISIDFSRKLKIYKCSVDKNFEIVEVFGH